MPCLTVVLFTAWPHRDCTSIHSEASPWLYFCSRRGLIVTKVVLTQTLAVNITGEVGLCDGCDSQRIGESDRRSSKWRLSGGMGEGEWVTALGNVLAGPLPHERHWPRGAAPWTVSLALEHWIGKRVQGRMLRSGMRGQGVGVGRKRVIPSRLVSLRHGPGPEHTVTSRR
jgi:hypothetical protein